MSAQDIGNLVDHSINWDFRNQHVAASYTDSSGMTGNTQKISVSDFIDSSTTLMCAGPASLSESMGANQSNQGIKLVPIGLAMGVNLQINRQSSKLFEIGSRLGYNISGRVAGGISMSRALIDGANLLKVLYAGEVVEDSTVEQLNSAGYYDKLVVFATGNDAETKTGIKVPAIGSGPVALNLDSAFFNHPFGLALIMRDQTNQTVSEHYFEGCTITSYSISISADANVLTEGVSMEFVRIVPIITSASVTDYSQAKTEATLADLPISGLGVVK